MPVPTARPGASSGARPAAMRAVPRHRTSPGVRLAALVVVLLATLAAAGLRSADARAADPPTTGSLAGTVRGDGEPLEGALVVVRRILNVGSSIGAIVYSGPDGTYRADGLPPDTNYVVEVKPPQAATGAGFRRTFSGDVPSRGLATRTTVEAGVVTDGFDVAAIPGAALAGRVTDARGPVPFVSVTAVNDNGEGAGAVTDGDGRWRVTGLDPTAEVTVGFTSNDHVTEYYDDQPTRELSTRVPLEVRVVKGGIDAVLERLATSALRGVVRDADGPVGGATVRLYDGRGTGIRRTTTDATGAYAFEGLEADAYVVGARAAGHSGRFFPDVAAQQDAAHIALGSNSDALIDDLVLPVVGPGAVAGRTVDRSGAGIAGVVVDLLRADGDPDAAPVISAVTGADGRWGLSGVAGDDYVVRYRVPGGTPVFHPSALAPDDATPVRIDGDVATVDLGDATLSRPPVSDGTPGATPVPASSGLVGPAPSGPVLQPGTVTPAPAPTVPAAPAGTLSRRSVVRVGRDGAFRLPVTCPPSRRCEGAVRVTVPSAVPRAGRGGAPLNVARGVLRPGQPAVALKLTLAGRKLLRRSGRLRVTVTLTGRGAATLASRRTLTLVGPRSRPTTG